MNTKQNLTDKELLFSKQVANEVEKQLPLLVAKEVDKIVKPSIENMRIHFAKKLGEEMVRLDTSLREIKSPNKGSNKNNKNDTIKQVTIIVIGALLVGLIPAIFQFIANALMK